MTKRLKRALEAAAALLLLANTIYFAATWESAALSAILVNAFPIAAIAVLIVHYLPRYIRESVRQEFARQRVLDGVEARLDAASAAGDDVIHLDQRRDATS